MLSLKINHSPYLSFQYIKRDVAKEVQEDFFDSFERVGLYEIGSANS